jgi:hypothetical protein
MVSIPFKVDWSEVGQWDFIVTAVRRKGRIALMVGHALASLIRTTSVKLLLDDMIRQDRGAAEENDNSANEIT